MRCKALYEMAVNAKRCSCRRRSFFAIFIYNASTYNSAIVAANIGSLHCHNYIVAMQHVDTYVELWHCIVRSENLVRPKC